jgi:hypothetical protein
MYNAGILMKVSKRRGKLKGIFKSKRWRQPLAMGLEDIE